MADAPVWRRCYAWSIHDGYLCIVTGPESGDGDGGWEWMIRRQEDPEYIADHGVTRWSHEARAAADHAAREAAQARRDVEAHQRDLYEVEP